MVTMGVFPFQGKTHMVEPGMEPGTSRLVVRSSDHQATRMVIKNIKVYIVVYDVCKPTKSTMQNITRHCFALIMLLKRKR